MQATSRCKTPPLSLSSSPLIGSPDGNARSPPATAAAVEMTPRAVSSRYSLDSCTLQLHAWKPFHQHQISSSDHHHPRTPPSGLHHLHAKKPCRSDRSTAPYDGGPLADLSRLSLLDADHPSPSPTTTPHWIAARKRRRRGSRSVSGRSSERSGTRRASAAYATCSDFPLVAGGTDSSGELFVNGDGGSWGSDASEARVSREAGGLAGMERESSGSVSYLGGGGGGGVVGVIDSQGNESGYGSEPGYRGDAELGYGDEFDEEDDDGRPLFWGEHFVGDGDHMEIVGENKFSEQKAHHRCRRKK